MQVGDKIDFNTCLICPIKSVNGIYPVRWDGEEGCYVVCVPDDATYTIMACTDEEDDAINIIITKEFSGKETLIDLF